MKRHPSHPDHQPALVRGRSFFPPFGAGHLLLLCCLAAACGPAAPPPQDPSALPPMKIWEPVPQSITATRDFAFKPSGEALRQIVDRAVAEVPLVFECGTCMTDARAAHEDRSRSFARWVRALGRTGAAGRRRKPSGPSSLKPSGPSSLDEVLGSVAGVKLSKEVQQRLVRVPADQLVDLFFTLSDRGRGPYVVQDRRVMEGFTGDEVVLRVRRQDGKSDEVKVRSEEIMDLAQVKKNLKRLAEEHGAKLSPMMRRDLVVLSSADLAPTLILDSPRTQEARRQAAEKIARSPLTFAKGQVVANKGETYTLPLRALLARMVSVRCEPCMAGAVACSSGLLRRLRVGGVVYRTIRATRDFYLPASPRRLDLLGKEAAAAVPPFLVIDDQIHRDRVAKLGQILDLALALEGKQRHLVLSDRLESDLGTKVLLQLIRSLDAGPADQVHEALLELYGRLQARPQTAGQAPPGNRPCTLGRGTGDGGKRTVRTYPDCPVVVMTWLRGQIPERAELLPALVKLPRAARKAVIELVQQLMASNTTFDEAETRRRRDKARAAVTGGAQFFFERDVVIPAGHRLTDQDLYVLKSMFSIRCMPVLKPQISSRPRE